MNFTFFMKADSALIRVLIRLSLFSSLFSAPGAQNLPPFWRAVPQPPAAFYFPNAFRLLTVRELRQIKQKQYGVSYFGRMTNLPLALYTV